ncbi:ogr/Delta-like zinc finger family protein [Enterobacter cloacae]|uniref:ogr/Delta-like zinc finger family protein n=1 Tax=Enterobacter cloacae TaxID=550 RepID=UPI00317120E5
MQQNALKSWKVISYFTGAKNMRVLKIFCPECKSPAIIRRSVPKGDRFSDLYCACKNVECGHTYVLELTYARPLSPSALATDRLVKELVGQLSPEQRQFALDLLQAS